MVKKFLILLFSLNLQTENLTGKTVVADQTMVVTRHYLASEVGNQVLTKGGNAIDAAVAVSFALAVVLPQAGNIGGGGFMIFYDKEMTIYIHLITGKWHLLMLLKICS